MSDESDILKMLAQVLKHLEKEHKSPPNKTGVQKYPSGIISVDVHSKPIYWFFDEYEFADWVKVEATRIQNDN